MLLRKLASRKIEELVNFESYVFCTRSYWVLVIKIVSDVHLFYVCHVMGFGKFSEKDLYGFLEDL